MNMKASLKYQLADHKKSIIIFYITILFVYLIVIASVWGMEGGTGFTRSLSGIELATAIFLFVSGLCSFKENFLMLGQNGISRKTVFLSRVVVNIMVALGMAIIDRVLWIIFKTAAVSSGKLNLISLFEMANGGGVAGISNMIFNLEGIGFSLVIYLFCLFIGYFITIMFYRLSKAGKAIVGAGVPVMLTVVLPIIDQGLAGGRISKFLCSIVALTMGTMGKLIISFIVLSAVFAAISWLLMRKAPVRQ